MFITILLIYLIHIEARINPLGPTVVSDFSNCVIQIMDIDFKIPGLLIFANSKDASTPVRRIGNKILSYVHMSSNFSVEITSSDRKPATCGNHDETVVFVDLELSKYILIANYFILMIDSHEDLYNLVNKLINSRTWNPSAHFIVLLYQFQFDDRTNLENILTCLYKYNVINVIVIVPEANDIRKAIIYSWKPYDPPRYCGYDNETAKHRLRKENLCERGRLKSKRNLFENKIPSDMKGCRLDIIALERQPFISANKEDPNIEEDLVNQVFKRYNLRPNYEIIQLNRGERYNREWDGALGEIVKKKGNVLLGGIFPDFDVHEDFECSFSYLSNEYTWVVPRAFPSPPWVALTIIFQKSVWLLAAISFIVCSFVWKLIGLYSGDSLYNRILRHSFLNTWICTLGFCTYTRPNNSSLRVFFVFLNLYCLMFITAFTAKLVDVLRNPTFIHQIDTIEELISSDLKFGGQEELHDIFNNSDDPIDDYIFTKWIVVEDIHEALIDVAVHRNFSLLCSRLELAHKSTIMPELSDNFGQPKYFAFEFNVFSVPLEMIGLKGFPFISQFSKILSLLKQSGENAKLRRSFSYNNLRKKAKLQRFLKIQMPEIDALSIQHLQGGFLALLFGYTAGALTFIFEVVLNTNFAKNWLKNLRNNLKRD